MARTKLPTRPPLDSDVRAQIAAIRRRSNVLGHAFGSRRVGHEWEPGHFLTFYVRNKYPDELLPVRRLRPIPEQIGNYRTDVLPIGEIVGCDLDHHDTLIHGNSEVRPAAVVRYDGEVRVLMAGHAAPGASGSLVAKDVVPSKRYDGQVLGRKFAGGGSVDWAVAVFRGLGITIDSRNFLTGDTPPLRVSPAKSFTPEAKVRFMIPGEIVNHGELIHYESACSVTHNGVELKYSSLLAIRSTMTRPFAERGDSGQLVFDAQNRAIGMIVGVSTAGDPVTLVATIHALRHDDAFIPFYSNFFAP